MGRYVAERDTVTADTEYGPIRVKRKWLAGEMVSAAPEYDDVVSAAQAHGVGLPAVADAIKEIL